jgi:predicted kinase
MWLGESFRSLDGTVLGPMTRGLNNPRVSSDREGAGFGNALVPGPLLSPIISIVSLLVVMSGLPGVGKSAIARELALRCSLFYVELDLLEAALFRQGISGDQLGWAGYEMITTLAANNLAIGNSVLLDAVTWTTAIRQTWSELVAHQGAQFRPIEVICSDHRVHRERLEQRCRDFEGLPETSRADVQHAIERYEPWTGERLILDSSGPKEALITEAVEYLGLSPS